jgi:protein-S-isoprenylcysteine O-methyltransferase Ste14
MIYLWFIIFTVCLFIFIPIHFLSVNHIKLEKKFGELKGKRIGSILGMISGWGFFICLFGIWLSPQPRFIIPNISIILFEIPMFNIPFSLGYMILSIPFIILSIWLGVSGVQETGLEVSETHRAKKVINKGIYSKIRHPQYLAAILAHVGFSVLFAGFFSLIITPLIVLYNYMTAWKEEKELIREFGQRYKQYAERVPMFIPRLIKKK